MRDARARRVDRPTDRPNERTNAGTEPIRPGVM